MSSARAVLCPHAATGAARAMGGNHATDRSTHRRNNGTKRWVRPIAPGRRGVSETRPDVSTEALTPPKSDADVAAMRARLKEKQQKLMDKLATRKELQAVREKNPKDLDRQDGRPTRVPSAHPNVPADPRPNPEPNIPQELREQLNKAGMPDPTAGYAGTGTGKDAAPKPAFQNSVAPVPPPQINYPFGGDDEPVPPPPMPFGGGGFAMPRRRRRPGTPQAAGSPGGAHVPTAAGDVPAAARGWRAPAEFLTPAAGTPATGTPAAGTQGAGAARGSPQMPPPPPVPQARPQGMPDAPETAPPPPVTGPARPDMRPRRRPRFPRGSASPVTPRMEAGTTRSGTRVPRTQTRLRRRAWRRRPRRRARAAPADDGAAERVRGAPGDARAARAAADVRAGRAQHRQARAHPAAQPQPRATATAAAGCGGWPGWLGAEPAGD